MKGRGQEMKGQQMMPRCTGTQETQSFLGNFSLEDASRKESIKGTMKEPNTQFLHEDHPKNRKQFYSRFIFLYIKDTSVLAVWVLKPQGNLSVKNFSDNSLTWSHLISQPFLHLLFLYMVYLCMCVVGMCVSV